MECRLNYFSNVELFHNTTVQCLSIIFQLFNKYNSHIQHLKPERYTYLNLIADLKSIVFLDELFEVFS